MTEEVQRGERTARRSPRRLPIPFFLAPPVRAPHLGSATVWEPHRRGPATIAHLSTVSRNRRSAILAPRLLERAVRVAPSPLATPRGAWVCSNATSGSGRALRRSPWRPSPAPTRRLHTAHPHAPAFGVAEVRRPAFV